MRTYIVTGTSKGLGEAIVRELLQPENELICLSRKENTQLNQEAKEKGVPFTFYSCDVSQNEQVKTILSQIFERHDFSSADSMTLINNAGIVEPIETIGKTDSEALDLNISINLIAPIILTNWFIHAFSDYSIEKIIVNITSGAARNPYHGWAAYCSSKAGLDMFTKTVSIEQNKATHPVKVMAFSPGVMDTEMQGQIRSSSEESFAEVNRFRELDNKGMLRSPEFVANKLIALITNDFNSGAIYDITGFLD